MAHQLIISSADVEKLKQRARTLKKSESISHAEALDRIAKSAGFHHWHHVTEAAKAFAPTEDAYHRGVIIMMEMKGTDGFPDPAGRFVEDWLAFTLCPEDLYRLMAEERDEDEVPMRDQHSEEELREFVREDSMNYVFYRFEGESVPRLAEDVVAMVQEFSFWPPEVVWCRGICYQIRSFPLGQDDASTTPD